MFRSNFSCALVILLFSVSSALRFSAFSHVKRIAKGPRSARPLAPIDSDASDMLREAARERRTKQTPFHQYVSKVLRSVDDSNGQEVLVRVRNERSSFRNNIIAGGSMLKTALSRRRPKPAVKKPTICIEDKSVLLIP